MPTFSHENEADIPDADLVRRSLADPDAFSCIVRRYWQPLFRYIKRISFSTDEDAEDILQEVFLKTYRHLNDFDRDLRFSTWIYRICRNTVIDAIRKKGSRPPTMPLDDATLTHFFRSSTNIAHETAVKEHHQAIVNLIEELPLKYREVLVLKFLEDRSYEEIIDIIGKPKGTVASLINRGRKILAEKAKQRGLLPSQVQDCTIPLSSESSSAPLTSLL